MRHHLIRTAALGLTLAALIAPAAVAQQDLRGADARGVAVASIGPVHDLRLPDTRDAAIGRVEHSVPAPVAADGSGSTVVLIAAGIALLIAAAAAAAVVTVRRRLPEGRLVTALGDGTREWRRGVGL